MKETLIKNALHHTETYYAWYSDRRLADQYKRLPIQIAF